MTAIGDQAHVLLISPKKLDEAAGSYFTAQAELASTTLGPKGRTAMFMDVAEGKP